MKVKLKVLKSAKKKIILSMILSFVIFMVSAINYFFEMSNKMVSGQLEKGLSIELYMILPLSMILMFSLQLSSILSLSKNKMNIEDKIQKMEDEINLSKF
jgi:peptidoglycan hydrolase CwlO-like protein